MSIWTIQSEEDIGSEVTFEIKILRSRRFGDHVKVDKYAQIGR